MNRKTFGLRLLGAVCALGLSWPLASMAADEAPDAFIKRVAVETLDAVKADKSLKNGDVAKIMQLVDGKLVQHINFRRMTALATGPSWRKATPEQQKRLQEEFKLLLVRTYAGALSQVSDQTIEVKPVRGEIDEKNLVIRTEVKGRGDPIQLDYRLEKTPGEGAGWLIYDLNVMGIWLIENYKSQFTKEINTGGLDGLINSLAERNKSNNKKS
jgi:phospholipid transport system substrate-binding protein